MFKLFQKIVNGIYNMMGSGFLTYHSDVAPTALQCQACGNIPETLTTIMIGNKQWFVCDTDKCKRDVLKQLIIEVI
jgi:hypothetical protein